MIDDVCNFFFTEQYIVQFMTFINLLNNNQYLFIIFFITDMSRDYKSNRIALH